MTVQNFTYTFEMEKIHFSFLMKCLLLLALSLL